MNRSDLHNFQLAASDHQVEHVDGGSALWADMGLGKTIITLTSLQRLRDSFDLGKSLVIAPARVARRTWTDEAAVWEHIDLRFSQIIGTPKQRMEAIQKDAEVYVISRDNLDWLVDMYRPNGSRFIQPWPWETVVQDESTSFKHQNSSRWKAMRRVMPQVERVYQLTGQPAANHVGHLWGQMRFLDRGLLGTSEDAFKHRWFDPPDYGGWAWKPKPHALKQITERVKHLTFALRAEDYLDLPKVQYNDVPVYMDNAEYKRYLHLKREFVLPLKDAVINAVNAGVLWGKLVQLANGAVYDQERQVHHIHDHKIKALEELVDTATGPMLVFYWFIHDKDRIITALERLKKRRKFTYRVVKSIQDEDDWNDGKIDIGLMHPKSAGHGLNLQQGGELIVWFGITQDLELHDQANARIIGGHRRIGKHPIIHYITCENTIDNDMALVRANREDDEKFMMSIVRRLVKEAA